MINVINIEISPWKLKNDLVNLKITNNYMVLMIKLKTNNFWSSISIQKSIYTKKKKVLSTKIFVLMT